MKDFFAKHKWGIVVAFLVGLICVLPQLVFIRNLGGQYRGIHIYATPNEAAYMAIMQEILDGHPQVGSMPFFEYKDGIPLLPATLVYLYTIPVQVFGISLVNAVLAGKFVFPALLFFIVYLFIFDLLKIEDEKQGKWRILFALAAASMVVFGFDLVDYRSMIFYLKGLSSPEGFLIWTRPINPVSGAILLFSWLFCLNKTCPAQRSGDGLNLQNKKRWIVWCGIFLALMMASYVFSWTLAVVILGLFGLEALFKKNWKNILNYLVILILGVIFSLPYWINTARAAKMPWYNEAAARIGMYFTRAPHFNKIIIVTLILFLFATVFGFYKRALTRPLPSWWRLSAILLLGSLIVYNQQVITGREIWYYHYVFYTIPLAYTVFIMLLWHVAGKIYPWLAKFAALALLIVSILFGLFWQISAYVKTAPEYARKQDYRDVFDFFNYQAEKDCVILAREENIGEWSGLIPAFTHCNTYYSGENQSVLANPDDFYYRYMALLRLRGVKGGEIEQYVISKKSEVEHALEYQLQRTLGFPDPKMEERLLHLPEDYREFIKNDFVTQLSRFRLDYIMSEGKLSPEVLAQLPNIKEVALLHNLVIYKF